MIEPVIVGSGTAGQALRLALGMYPRQVGAAVAVERGAPLPPPASEHSLLVLANPHALHAPRLLEAAERGYRYALCEKPAAVDLDQVAALAGLPVETWICHGYRLLWGPQELRRAWEQGRFGEVLAVEGRYWQAGVLRRPATLGWKDDPDTGGRFDTLLDLGTHWADLAIFLTGGRPPDETRVRRWFVNAPSAHRDTHVHLTMLHGDVASFGSISKTVHGAGNLLELHVLGEKATASWSFAEPDVLTWGEASSRRTEVRTERQRPATLAPFHGMGWLEGYGRLVGEAVGHILDGRASRAPTLEQQLVVLEALLGAATA